jgi:hypothetical protein
MRVRLRVLTHDTPFASAGPAQASAAPGWSPAASKAPAWTIPPTTCATSAAAARASCVAPGCAWSAPPGGEPMPHPRPPTDTTDAAERARAWLAGRHCWNRDLVVVLLRHVPEADVARALDRLSAGELGRLARLLAAATDLHQIARRIVAELHSSSTPTSAASGGRDDAAPARRREAAT